MTEQIKQIAERIKGDPGNIRNFLPKQWLQSWEYLQIYISNTRAGIQTYLSVSVFKISELV